MLLRSAGAVVRINELARIRCVDRALDSRWPAYDEAAVKASSGRHRARPQESAMRLQPQSNAATALPAATTKSSRTPHTPAMKAAPAAVAATPAKAAAPVAKTATAAKAAEVAAAPETYGGAGSLLDAHA
jgi:hypothetical protein